MRVMTAPAPHPLPPAVVHDPFTPPAPTWLTLLLVVATVTAVLGAAGLATRLASRGHDPQCSHARHP